MDSNSPKHNLVVNVLREQEINCQSIPELDQMNCSRAWTLPYSVCCIRIRESGKHNEQYSQQQFLQTY